MIKWNPKNALVLKSTFVKSEKLLKHVKKRWEHIYDWQIPGKYHSISTLTLSLFFHLIWPKNPKIWHQVSSLNTFILVSMWIESINFDDKDLGPGIVSWLNTEGPEPSSNSPRVHPRDIFQCFPETAELMLGSTYFGYNQNSTWVSSQCSTNSAFFSNSTLW